MSCAVPYKKEIMLVTGEKVFLDFELSDARIANDSFIEYWLVDQYYKAIKDLLDLYKKSELPNRMIKGQDYTIVNGIYHSKGRSFGFYCPDDDSIIYDADTIAGLSRVPAEFIFAHELGHKIAKYRLTDDEMKELAYLANVSYDNKEAINETYADACGSILCPDGKSYYQYLDCDYDRDECIKRLVLKSCYKC
jgi:hypothetical protein